MSKLKQLKSNTKISKSEIKQRGGECEQFPTFSFYHLTSNNNYNFKYFNSSQNLDKVKTQSLLYERLEEISHGDWMHWYSLSKKVGCESLEIDRVHFNPKGIEFTPDHKVIVFRFDHQSKRILGFRKDKCPIYYIIGYDFDMSAYNHG